MLCFILFSSSSSSFSLRLFQKFVTFRILVCGGDGSVGWVLSELDKLNLHKQVRRRRRRRRRGDDVIMVEFLNCFYPEQVHFCFEKFFKLNMVIRIGSTEVSVPPKALIYHPCCLLSFSDSVSSACCLWAQGMTWPVSWAGEASVTTTLNCCRSWKSWRGPPLKCWTGEATVGGAWRRGAATGQP